MEFTIEKLSKRIVDTRNAINELVARYPKITSDQEAARWKSDVLALHNELTLIQADLVQFQNIEKGLLQQEENARMNFSFVKRLSASKESEKKHKEKLQELQECIESVETSKSLMDKIVRVLKNKK